MQRQQGNSKGDSGGFRALPGSLALCIAALVCCPRAQEIFPDNAAGNGLYSLPRSQDDIAELEEARRLIEEKRFDSAVERLHLLLQRRTSKGVVPTSSGVDRYVGVRRAVITMLRDLPEAGEKEYERLCRREAGARIDRPVRGLGREDLEYLAESFPTSAAGVRARIRLGDLALESGLGLEAQTHFRAALDALPPHEKLAKSVGMRQAAAGLLVQGRARATASDDSGLEATLRQVLPSTGDNTWVAYGGGHDGRRPMDAPVGDCRGHYGESVRAEGFFENPLALHATGDLTGLYVNDGWWVHAFDPIARTPLWHAPGGMIDATEDDDARRAINPGMVLACAVGDDIVVASLQVPNDVVGARQTRTFRNTIPIIEKIPSRRLYAFDRATGKLVWAHWDFKAGPVSTSYRGHDSCSAPLIEGDTVYAATHDQTGAIMYYLSAYDLHTGRERWRRLICSSQQEVNMFGNARQEFAAGPLAMHDGVVYGTTNLGVCYACDADDGEIRWVSGYQVIPLPRTQLHNQETRPVFFANNPIVIADGVMATTPLDSAHALGFDTRTGRQLWRIPYEGAGRGVITIRWLLGAIGDEFIFSGAGILAAKARPTHPVAPFNLQVRVLASSESVEEDSYGVERIPRGALTEDRIYFVGSDGLLRIFDNKGNRDPRMTDLRLEGKGNLLMIDGIVALCRNGAIDMYADLESLVRVTEKRLSDDPSDPAALLRLASLQRARAGQDLGSLLGQKAESLYRKGLDAATQQGLGMGSPLYKKLAQGLFQVSFHRALDVARTDRQKGRLLLAAARERAALPEQWLEAQQAILASCASEPETYLQELDRMTTRYGPMPFRFEGTGSIPVAAYALWQSIPHLTDPAQAAMRCQELMDRFADVRLGERTAREIAIEVLGALIEEHGRGAYAEIEKRARARLQEAGNDMELLRLLSEQYPHSESSERATARLLDVAVAAGDLHTAARSFADAAGRGDLGPGLLRRMQVAALAKGNFGLALALGDRLRAGHAGESSDFAPDGGREFSAILAELPPVPAAAPVSPQKPVEELTRLDPPNRESTLNLCQVELAEGFARPPEVPLYGIVDDTQLHAFRLDPLPAGLGDYAFTTPFRSAAVEPVLLCGSVLILCELGRIRGIDYLTGEPLWELKAERRRSFQSLGVQQGVLHLFSAIQQTGGDGGRLIGVEPISGAVLFRHVFDPERDSTSPVSCAGSLYTVDPGGRTGAPAIHRLDAVTGAVTSVTPLRPDVLEFLGLGSGRDRYRLHNQDFQTGIFADSASIFIPLNPGDDSPPRLCAIGHDGALKWGWRGMGGQSLVMAATWRGHVVLLERGQQPFGRLMVLDRSGQVVKTQMFGEEALVHNWQRGPRHAPAPDTLLITDRDRSPRLACVSLDGSRPSFIETMSNVDRILPSPVLGDDFVALGTLRDNTGKVLLQVLDLKTRRGALPDGARSSRLELARPLKVFSHERYVVLYTFSGLIVLGTR